MDRITNRQVRGIVHTAIVLLCTGVSPGVEFAGGTGEPNDPYQIATAEQLIVIGSDPNLATRHFILMAEIDMSATTWSSPVIASFQGSLDGDGHAVRGLTIRGAGPIGLFFRIERTARIVNLSLLDVRLMSTSAVGALGGHNYGAVVNCRSTGSVVGLGDTGGAAGLVGANDGTITDSFSAVEVTGYQFVGGLVALNQAGIILRCGSTSSVAGNGYVGGLVGRNDGSITASYSHGDAMGASELGGLVGSNRGGVSSCYSTGIVTGGDQIGGLVGDNYGKVSWCYSGAVVTSQGVPGGRHVGGLIGRGLLGSSVRDSFFLAAADGGGPDNTIGVPLTLAQMTQQGSFPHWDFWGTDADGLVDHWFMPVGEPPVLAWQTEITGLRRVPDVTELSRDRAEAVLTAAEFVPGGAVHDVHRTLPVDRVIHADPSAIVPLGEVVTLVLSVGGSYDWAGNPGDGTAANPYQIQTAGQLESIADHPELLDKHFVLTADVDMSGRVYAAAVVAPDGDKATAGFQGVSFTGTFDGQGHTIHNLTVAAESGEHMGLFGRIGQSGRISRLHLLSASVGRGHSNTVGVLAGYSEGTVAGCSATDSVVIRRDSGDGLVGVNAGDIIDCRADVTVVIISSGTTRR